MVSLLTLSPIGINSSCQCSGNISQSLPASNARPPLASTLNKMESANELTKMVNQCIHFHVERNQKGWVHALHHIRFHIMSTTSKSTGYSPFHLRFGRLPHILPPLLEPPPNPSVNNISACKVIENLLLTLETTLSSQKSPHPTFQTTNVLILPFSKSVIKSC